MPVRFRSLLLHMPVAGARPAWIDVATLARLLNADLRAVYCEDEALFEVAELPCAREFDPMRLHQERWRSLERGQLLRDFELAAASLRRQLDRVARTSRVGLQFTVVRAGTPPPEPTPDAIRVIATGEPASAAGSGRSPDEGALLFMPAGALRRHGDVVVLARSTEGLAARIGQTMARNAGARVIVLEAAGDAEQLQHDLGRLHERLLVVDWNMLKQWEDAARLAALRRVPVLAVTEDPVSAP